MCNFSCKFCNWIQNNKLGCEVHTCVAIESDRNYINEMETKKYCEFLCVEFDDACNDDNKKNLIRCFLNRQCPDSHFYIDADYGIYCLESQDAEINISICIDSEFLPEYINFIRVPGRFSISGGNLKTLRGCPQYVGLGFNCSFNKLETLEYAPKIVNFKEKEEDLTKWDGQKFDESVSFDCGNNLLTSLDNCPIIKRGSILCQGNKIQSLKGIQNEINGSLQCSNNELSTFDYLPKINKGFYADSNLFEHIDEESIKKISGCEELSIKWCDKKIKSKNSTKDFIKKVSVKFDEQYDFNDTVLSTPNGKISVKCKKHKLAFEAYPNEFLGDVIACPICRMEKYGFKPHNKENYTAYPREQQDKDICIHPSCVDKELIDKIAKFINDNVTPNIYYTYFIGEDYIIDVEPGYEYAWQGLNNPYKGISVSVESKSIPEYIKFGNAIVSRFTITSKKWDFSVEKWVQGEKLDTFEGCPNRVFGDFICKNENVSSFVGMPNFIGGIFDISNNILDDNAWDYAKEHIDAEFGDYKISNNKFVKYRKELY